MLLTIIESGVFTGFLADPRLSYWRLIPVLLRLNKKINTAMWARLSPGITGIFRIFTGHKCDTVTSNIAFQINITPAILARLYITKFINPEGRSVSVLSECIRYFRARDHWRELSMMPIDAVTDWRICREIFNKLSPDIDENMLFPDCNKDGHIPSEIFAFLEDPGGMISHRREISNYEYTTIVTVNPKNKYVDYAIEQPDYKYDHYEISKLPVQTTNINYYVSVFWFSRDLDLIGRFYDAYGTQMPSIGAWDFFMFCSMFHLDPRVMSAVI